MYGCLACASAWPFLFFLTGSTPTDLHPQDAAGAAERREEGVELGFEW